MQNKESETIDNYEAKLERYKKMQGLYDKAKNNIFSELEKIKIQKSLNSQIDRANEDLYSYYDTLISLYYHIIIFL